MKFGKELAALGLTLAFAAGAQAQRTINEPVTTKTSGPAVTAPKPPPAPASVKAKYEGGLVGYGKTEGTLNFDDQNERLVFRDKKGAELFSLSYRAVSAAWADTKAQRPLAGSVIASTVPYGLGLPALFIKEKHRYLVLQYRDPDTQAEGLTSFKLPSKELLASVLYSFGEKAGLTQRGDAFIRRKEETKKVAP